MNEKNNISLSVSKNQNDSKSIVIPIHDQNDLSKSDNLSSSITEDKNLNIDKMLARARHAFQSNLTKSLDFRKKQLKGLFNMLEVNQDLIIESLKSDLNKGEFETILCEIEIVKNEIRCILQNINKWAKPESASRNLSTILDDLFIHSEPYGVVLIIGAWNYPVQLTLSPLAGAIGAGNCIILKPSELSPATAKMLSELIPRYIDKECYQVFNGGIEETQALLKERFDYIFYTGGCNGAKVVYQSASKYLTPVSLELGGKSPVYIDSSISGSMETVLRRIFWGKYINAGQTCIAPDYIICDKKMQEKIQEIAPKIVREFYGDEPKKSADFARIVNEKHFQRLVKLLDSCRGKIILGGQTDAETKYISPTIIADVQSDDSIMQEEIFGPILPIMVTNTLQESIDYINSKEKPLSLYVFSNKPAVIDKFTHETSSGSLTINDVIFQVTVDSLPFGGVGNSGIGKYHGKFSFDTFSHKKSILNRTFNPLIEYIAGLRYPPYNNKRKLNILNELMKKRKYPQDLMYLVVFMFGVSAVLLVEFLTKFFF